MCRAHESLSLAQGHDHVTAGFLAISYRRHNIYGESYFLDQKFKILGFYLFCSFNQNIFCPSGKKQKTKDFNETFYWNN